MTTDLVDSTIDTYVRDAARHLVGPPAHRQRITDDLAAHLDDAAIAGHLEVTMQRLGPPAAAAAVFSTPVRPVSFARRLTAAAIDLIPLFVVTVAVFADRLFSATPGDTVGAVFPPIIAVDTGPVCVSPVPFVCDTGFHATTDALSFALVACALIWSIVVVAVLEARTGQTPGKRVVGIFTSSSDGLSVTLSQAISRRLSLLMGPLAWLDWLPYLWGDARRLSDHFCDTRVGTLDNTDESL